MTNFRKSTIAAIATVGIISASAIAAPTAAKAGNLDIAGAFVGGLIVGTIAGQVAQQQRPVYSTQPVYSAQPVYKPRHRNKPVYTYQNRYQDDHGEVLPVANNSYGSQCYTREETTVDRWGNMASSIRQVCN